MRLFPYLSLTMIMYLQTGPMVAAQVRAYKKAMLLMGSRFEITAICDDERRGWAAINSAVSEMQRIERLISSWDNNSQTSEINRNAGIRPVSVDKELFDLIARALKVSKLTNGAFDISYAAMDELWKFDGSMPSLPSGDAIKASVANIDYNNVILDHENVTVYLKNKGMKIGFGAMGKGYAANQGKKAMMALGIKGGLVNAGGDLITWGREENGGPWSIGIADPKDKNKIFSWLEVSDMAVVTSGNYEKYFLVNGEKYTHIIDPRSGYPVRGLKSVTIICPDAELADGLATSVFVLGQNKGLSLINQLNKVECIIINEKDEVITSKNLALNYYTQQPTTVRHNYVLGKTKKE